MPAIYTAGDEISIPIIILDQNSDPLTGLTGGSGAGGFTNADFQVTLSRQSGTTYVAATDIVTVAEGLPLGTYVFRYTPANTGRHLLHVKELNAATNGYTHDRHNDVVTAGSIFVPSLAECFCSEPDIERWLQQSLTGTTRPSSTEAAAFAETRSAMLQALCARLGYSVTPSTVTSGSRLQDLLREANAIGAACDCVSVAAFGVAPSRTEKAEWLEKQWDRYFGKPGEDGKKGIIGLIEMEISGNLASLSTDHILSGDTIAATPTYPTDAGILVSVTDLY